MPAADASKAGIETWIRERRNDLLVFAKQPGIVEHLRQFRTRDRTPATLRKANEDDSVAEYLALIHDTFGGYESILLIDARSGIVVAASESERIGTTAFDAATLPILTASGAEETLAINASEGRSRTILRIFRQVIDPQSDAVLGLFVIAIDLEGELRREKYDGIVSLHSDDTSDGCYGFVSGDLLREHLLEPALQAASDFLPRNEAPIIDGFLAKRGINVWLFVDDFDAFAKIEPSLDRPVKSSISNPSRSSTGAIWSSTGFIMAALMR